MYGIVGKLKRSKDQKEVILQSPSHQSHHNKRKIQNHNQGNHQKRQAQLSNDDTSTFESSTDRTRIYGGFFITCAIRYNCWPQITLKPLVPSLVSQLFGSCLDYHFILDLDTIFSYCLAPRNSKVILQLSNILDT